jgi:hypothetical protein
VFFVLFWVMGGFLCHDTLLFWFTLQGGCEGPKVVLFFSLTWVTHIETTFFFNKFTR